MRTIFLGMDQKRDELLFSNVKGKNPFKDRRVRQAVYQAIDIEAIRTRIMRGVSTPAGIMVAPSVEGFVSELNKRLPFDADGARRLLTEAGYPSGFEVGMNCPNDRYVNDGEICQAVASMLAKVGLKVNLVAEPKTQFFPKVLSRNVSFYLAGWTPASQDAHNALFALMSTPGEGAQGQFNGGGYSNPKVDDLTRRIGAENDPAKRTAMIAEAFKIHQDDIGHIPLHQQPITWGLRKSVEMVQIPDNFQYLRWVTVK
jgi:peptide/nickel transport system substrate-binding protein